MTNKLSVRDVVTKIIKEHGALTPIEIIKKSEKPKAQVYTAISKLKGSGYLTRFADGSYALADPMVKAVEVKNTESRLSAARAEIDNLQHKLQDLTIKYYDTLAIMRYLESKLNITRK